MYKQVCLQCFAFLILYSVYLVFKSLNDAWISCLKLSVVYSFWRINLLLGILLAYKNLYLV